MENTVGKGEIARYFKRLVLQTRKNQGLFGRGLNLSQRQNFGLFSKLKEFADDNFTFDENGRKFSKRVENTGKRRYCSLRAISPFPTAFSKNLYCRHVKTRACSGKGKKTQRFWICSKSKLSSRAISPFLTVFSKDFSCRNVESRACLAKG